MTNDECQIPPPPNPSSPFYCSTITVADERQVLWDRIYRSLSTAVYNTLCQFDCAQRFCKRRRFAGVCAKPPTVCCLSASSGRGGGGLVNWNSCSVAGRENNCPFLPLCSGASCFVWLFLSTFTSLSFTSASYIRYLIRARAPQRRKSPEQSAYAIVCVARSALRTCALDAFTASSSGNGGKCLCGRRTGVLKEARSCFNGSVSFFFLFGPVCLCLCST